MERFFCETKRILMILLAIFVLVVVMMPNKSQAVTREDIISIARDTFNQIVIRDGKPYSQATGHTVAWPYKSSTIDCSSYVGVVLLRLGYTDFAGGQKSSYWWYYNSDSTIQKYGWESFYIQSKSDINKLRPGDILAFNGQIKGNYSLVCPTSPGNSVNHVQIVDRVDVAGKKVIAWDCGWHPVTYKLGPDNQYNAWFWGYYGRKGVKVIRITSENTVKATSVKMNRDVCMVQEGKTWSLTATVSPADATNKSLIWTSSNEKVAIVKGGQIIGQKEGEATITATTANGHKTTCKVYVYKSLTGKKTVKVGNKMKLDGSYKQYTICTPSVANIQSDNYLYGIKIGSAILRYVGNNNQALYYQVNVIENIQQATGVKLNRNVCMVQEGRTWWLSATVSPADATNKSLTWTSSNNKVAEIKNGQIIAKKAGEATITATTANGHKTTCKVYVYNSLTGKKTVKVGNKMKLDGSYKQYTICTPSVANIQSDNYLYGIKIGSAILRYVGNNNQALYYQVNVIENIQQATGVKLNRNVCMVQAGKTWWLSATVSPADATNKSLTWTSSNEKVATVKNGQIIAQKAGEATITATTANGHKTTCKVYVYNSLVAVKTIKKGQNVSLGERFDQYMTCTPEIAYIKDGNVLCGIEKGSVILRCVINRDRNAGAYYYLVKVE